MKKKKLAKICCVCYLTALSLAAFFEISASVRGDMEGIPTLDSLEKFYEESNNYTRRYVLKDLPNWMNKRGIPDDMPGWVYYALEDALNSYRPMLIREAAILTGKYGVIDFSERMAEIYKAAHRWFAADANIVRSAIVRALLNIGGVSAETYIPDLFMNSQRYLLSSEFKLLLTAIAQYGESSCIEELEHIEQLVTNIIASIPEDPWKDPSRDRYKYQDILGYVTVTKEKLIEKEGGDE